MGAIQYLNNRLGAQLLIIFLILFTLDSKAQWPVGMSPTSFQFNKNFTTGPATSQNLDITQDGVNYRYNLCPWNAATPALGGQINSMYNINTFNFKNSFSLCFQLRVVNTTATFQDRKTDGFSFVLQRILGATPIAGELSRIGQPGGGMGSLCNLSNSDQLLFEFDMFANSNTINGCPGPACDANDSQLAEHISINRDMNCTHAQNSSIAGNIMNPVGLRNAAVPNYTGFPYANTIRDGLLHDILITWTPSAPVNRFNTNLSGPCPAGGWAPGAWQDCPVVSCADPTVVQTGPNPWDPWAVPCYRQGGTFTITVNGAVRVNQVINDIWAVMNPNDAVWDFSYIFGFASTSQMFYPDEIWIKPCSSPLPVNFLDFNLTSTKGKALLEWSTSWEKQNSHFLIERSSDSENFEMIGSVNGKENSLENIYYSFADEEKIEGTFYYRLKQVDIDGRFTYSSIRIIALANKDIIHVFPNPTNGNIKVQLISDQGNLTDVILFNSLGQIVYQYQPGENQTEKILQMENLPSGIYMLQVKSDSELFTEKIIKE